MRYFKNVSGKCRHANPNTNAIYRTYDSLSGIYLFSKDFNRWVPSALGGDEFPSLNKEEITEEEAIAYIVFQKLK